MHEAREHARRRQPLQVRARLGETAADALDLADRKRRPTSAFNPIPRVTMLRRASSQEISTPSAASASSASASISVSS